MKGKILFIVGETIASQNDVMVPASVADLAIYYRLGKLGYKVEAFDLQTFINSEDQALQQEMEKPVQKLLAYKKRTAKKGEEDKIEVSEQEKAEIQEYLQKEKMYGLLGEIEIVLLASTILETKPEQRESPAAIESEATQIVSQSEADEPRTTVIEADSPEPQQILAEQLSAEQIQEQVSERFRHRLVPVIVLDVHLLALLGMAADKDSVALPSATRQIKIVKRESDRVGGLTGIHTITTAQIPFAVKNLPRTAVIIATTIEDETDVDEEVDNDEGDTIATNSSKNPHAFFYGYRSGTFMKDGRIAPARRIALLFPAEAAAQATDIGWEIFDRTIELAGKAATINDVFQAEWAEIRERRRHHHSAAIDLNHPPENLVGLALSGGGIRSATFSLGLLQGFKEKGVLKIFDYLSTVSGGGYMGGWWSAWLARDKNRGHGIFPRGEKIEAKRVSDYLKSKDKLNEGSLSAHTDPIHHLRLFSNYLTPRKGLLSSDTWQAITMMIRNIFLTWVVLLPVLFAFVLVGQFYFVLQQNSINEFLFPFQEKIRAAEERTERKLARLPEVFEDRRNEELNNRNLRLEQINRTVAQNNDEQVKKDQDLAMVTTESEKSLTELERSTEIKAKKLAAAVKPLEAQYSAVLGRRFLLSLYMLVPIAGLFMVTTVFWMRVGVTPPLIVKLAHTVPGIIFWLLVICVICLVTAVNFSDWQKLLELFGNGWNHTHWSLKLVILISLPLLTILLWWQSLPFKNDEKYEKVWKQYTGGNLFNGILIFLMIGASFAGLITLKEGVSKAGAEYIFWGVLAVVLFSIVIWLYSQPQNEDKWEWRKLIQGNRLMSIQSTLIVNLVVIALILGLSGYGYEIANYLLRDPTSQKSIADYVAKAGGWLALIASIAGSIFTAIKSSPAGGDDKIEVQGAGSKTRLIFALTPLLVLISLAVAFAWLARWMLIQFHEAPEHYIVKINKAILISVSLYLFLAIYEIRNWSKTRYIFLCCFGVAGVASLLYLSNNQFKIRSHFLINSQSSDWMLYCGLVAVGEIFTGILIALRMFRATKKRLLTGALICFPYILFFICMAFQEHFAAAKFLPFWVNDKAVVVSVEQSAAILAGIVCCGIVMVFEDYAWDGQTDRTLRVVTFTYLVLTCFLFFTFFVNYQKHTSVTMAYLTLGLLFLSVSWSVAIGWMTDPNLLSMHTFYKARLVRAYLGASNPNRNTQEISEAAGGDDVLLRELKNCQRGAPYHLINTTLNLVGGQDLATAQRSSDYFIFTKLYSGSSRTGYRRNLPEQYMQGQMSLGTAVAVSGAAVSPNMGAKTQTAAVAMLLTLLNVRLGYWASTPNRNLWRSAQAALWPVYMLKEFSSQTNDLSGYCYLTDGGHFDNTGLYSLVERACRFIILSDNGADTKPCFEDLGDAIRRCRIDFQAEISLDVTPFFKETDEASEDKLAKSHYIVGTIRYSEEHLRHIGWKIRDAQNPDKQQGVLILVKPSLIKEDSADLRQYARQNLDFPQQSTADFWYNEAQFESYRQIGKLCAEKVLNELGLATTLSTSSASPLTPEKVECAFNIARKTYEESIEEVRNESPEVRQGKFKEKLDNCMSPKPVMVGKKAPQTFDNELI
jgi:hypothetical protein